MAPRRPSPAAPRTPAGAGLTMRRARRGIVAVVVTGAAALAPVVSALSPAPAPALGPVTITTFAGGVGAGVATTVGQTPAAVVAGSGVVYVADTTFNVVRAV